MAITKSDIPDLMLAGLKTEFQLAYRNEVDNAAIERIATTINTTVPVQNYAWLGFSPPMREFVDERRPTGLQANATKIEDKVFESTLAVERRAIEDDQMDLIRIRIREMASRVALHRHKMLIDLLIAGPSTAAYDGEPFFSERTLQGTTYSNVSSAALNVDGIRGAVSAMMSVPDDTGMPMGIVPDTLVVGPSLMWTATELVESPTIPVRFENSPAFLNVFQGKLRVVVSPFLVGAAADTWYVLDTRRPIRPLILQQRSDVPVEFSALDNSSASEAAFMRDRYYYGVRARYNVGYGLWQLAYAGGVEA